MADWPKYDFAFCDLVRLIGFDEAAAHGGRSLEASDSAARAKLDPTGSVQEARPDFNNAHRHKGTKSKGSNQGQQQRKARND